MSRALWVGGLCGLVSIGCSNAPNGANGGDAGGSGGGTATGASLVGTWDVMTTPMGTNGAVTTTVTVGQNSLTVNSPSFVLTAMRTGNALTFTDEQTIGSPTDNVVLNATQTAATFNAGILPFDLGGSWALQIVQGQGTVMTCTLTVSSTEIDGACHKVTGGFDFSFTTAKMTSAASSLGDFGGTWMNTWMTPGTGGGTYPCQLSFTGNDITTCPGTSGMGASPPAGITFTYDGANTASGVAMGWAEYSATRR
jgi:hypothetical protein